MDIATVVDEYISPNELDRFRQTYEQQTRRGAPSSIAVFNYAHGLIKSSKEDVKTDLLKRDTEGNQKRDYVYYLSIAHTRLKEYDRALEYINVLLSAESDNRQAIELKELIEKRMKKEGLLGLAVLAFGGAAALAVGAVAGAVLTRRH